MGENPRPRKPTKALSAHEAGKVAPHKKPTYDPDAEEKLTPGQEEVLNLVAEGLSDSEISRKKGIAIKTVQKHIENTYKKLKVKTRAGAVTWLLTQRLEAAQQEIARLKEALAQKEK
jgi:DNA-binding NarL/FixJ family response regulator